MLEDFHTTFKRHHDDHVRPPVGPTLPRLGRRRKLRPLRSPPAAIMHVGGGWRRDHLGRWRTCKSFCGKLGHDRSAPFFGGVTGTLITGCGIERGESPVFWRRAEGLTARIAPFIREGRDRPLSIG